MGFVWEQNGVWHKHNPDGSLTSLKGHMIVKSYSQMYGIDYQDTSSAVVKLIFVHIIISLALTYHRLHQLDVKNIFLNGVLDEEVYMEQPSNFVAHEESGKVCKLKKSLYELKQSSKTWFG